MKIDTMHTDKNGYTSGLRIHAYRNTMYKGNPFMWMIMARFFHHTFSARSKYYR